MFKKCALAKFEWSGYPDELSDVFIESLILNSSTNNFAVCNFKSAGNDRRADGEFWSYYNVLAYEPKYFIPAEIQVTNGIGESFSTKDFVLFNNFKNNVTINAAYIGYYTQVIKTINKALGQHIVASELIATIYASSEQERADIEKVFKGFDGIRVVKHAASVLENGKSADIVQFEITPRLAELEQLKHDIERDLFLRLGIDAGQDKTHITNVNLKDSEQPIDLINAYELKLREDFCRRYNKWKGGGNLSVRIHNINPTNSIQNDGGSE